MSDSKHGSLDEVRYKQVAWHNVKLISPLFYLCEKRVNWNM